MNSIYHQPEHAVLRDQIARFLRDEVEPFGYAVGTAGLCTT
jgi:hypothetical protein